jgi:hypothetical protein
MKRRTVIARIAAASVVYAGLPLLGDLMLVPPRPVLAQEGAGLEAAATSRIVAGLSLPAGAYRSTSAENLAQFTSALSSVAKNAGGRVGQVEALIWLKSGGAGAKKALPGLLKKVGYGYAPEPTQDTEAGRVTLFGAGTEDLKRRVLGMWVEQSEVTVLAWGAFAKGNGGGAEDDAPAAPARPEILPPGHKPAARPADTDDSKSGDGNALVLNVPASAKVVNVMKGVTPKLPTFPELSPKRGYVRGYVYDTKGRPLKGAVIGVRATSAGGFYSGNSATTDARGYYEVESPWGVGHFYCAGYSVDYGDGRAALSLHPADGEAGNYASNVGAVKNWVLLPYGIADRDAVQNDPQACSNYYGGNVVLGWSVGRDGSLLASDSDLPAGGTLEVTFTPDGPLVDGSRGRTIIVRKPVGEGIGPGLYVNNIPAGAYKMSARLVGGGPLKMRETGPYANRPFGLDPKEATGMATLWQRPGSAKAGETPAGRSGWHQLVVNLTR